MSAELIMAIAGVAAAIAIPVWQLLHGEQRKKSLPKKIDITYFALKAFVAAQKSSLTTNSGLTYDQLYMKIIDHCNDHSTDGNFHPNRKNKSLRSYIDDSITGLSDPESETLKPLIEALDSTHKITELGLDIFDMLPSGRSEGAPMLDEYLSGSRDVHSTSSSGIVDQAKPVRTPGQPTTFQEWRHDVFMSMPEGEAFEFNDLRELMIQELSLNIFMKRSNDDSVKQAIDWNLEQGNLKRDDNGCIRLATLKSSKTLDDF